MIVDEIVYLISEHAGDDNVRAYLAHLLQTWSMMDRIWSKFKKNELTDSDKLPELPLVDKVQPAGIDDVRVDTKWLAATEKKPEELAAPAGETASQPGNADNSSVAGQLQADGNNDSKYDRQKD
jgi:hypothetical protein